MALALLGVVCDRVRGEEAGMKRAETHLLLRKCMAVSLASSSSERACVCWVLQLGSVCA